MPNRFDTFSAKDNDAVSYSVTVGYGQPGAIQVHLNTTPLKSATNSIPETSLGLFKDLKGKKLIVGVTILDTNPHTNNTSVTLEIKGGEKTKKIEESEEIEEGSVTHYFIVVSFVGTEAP